MSLPLALLSGWLSRHLKDMDSDNVHEQSWDKRGPLMLTFYPQTVKTILHEIYVVPEEKNTLDQKTADMKAGLGGAVIGREWEEQKRQANPTELSLRISTIHLIMRFKTQFDYNLSANTNQPRMNGQYFRRQSFINFFTGYRG